jgi:hypothetical protein
MGIVAKPSQVILLVEDKCHEQFIFRYLRKLGYEPHALRVLRSPLGTGSAEQWVRERFAVEVQACRRRQAQTKLIVMIDADTYTVQHRIDQLDQSLRNAGVSAIADDGEGVACLVPKRNIETWILCLNNVQVNEDTDYKRQSGQWTELIRAAVGTLYGWTRPHAAVPPSCVDSLWMGVRALQNCGL